LQVSDRVGQVLKTWLLKMKMKSRLSSSQGTVEASPTM
jgi:hypothetical protein